MSVVLNQPVANFSFSATDGMEGQLSDFRGKFVVLYFYPKDATPGCTTQAQEFRDHYAAFEALNTVILGISRDSLASHARFKDKQSLPFALISDSDENICQQFGVLKEKRNFGKTYIGVERSTFVIDEAGTLIVAQRKVKAAGHAAQILALLQQCHAPLNE